MSIDVWSLGVIVVTTLVLLVAKELAMINGTEFSLQLSKYLNIPIIIMVAIFVLLLALGVMEILQIKPL